MFENRAADLRQYLFVIKQISYKENKINTDETNLGVIWNVLNPLLYMVILSTFYSNVITHDNVENFPVFVFTGITMMNYYNIATKGAMHSFVNNKALLTKTHIPIEIFIFQKIFMGFREMLFSAVALIPIMAFFKIHLSWRIVQLIPIIVLTTVTILGIGELLAVIYVFFADIDYLYSVLMTMMLFVSGVFIPISYMPASLQGILSYNPIFLSIYLSRNSLIYNVPSHWTTWLKLLLWAIVTMEFGNFILSKNKNNLIGNL